MDLEHPRSRFNPWESHWIFFKVSGFCQSEPSALVASKLGVERGACCAFFQVTIIVSRTLSSGEFFYFSFIMFFPSYIQAFLAYLGIGNTFLATLNPVETAPNVWQPRSECLFST